MAAMRLTPTRLAAAPAARTTMPVRAFAADHAPAHQAVRYSGHVRERHLHGGVQGGVAREGRDEPLAFKAVMEKNAGFWDYLSNLTVSRDAKVSAIDKVFEGDKTQAVTKNLMMTMAANASWRTRRRWRTRTRSS